MAIFDPCCFVVGDCWQQLMSYLPLFECLAANSGYANLIAWHWPASWRSVQTIVEQFAVGHSLIVEAERRMD